MDFLLLTTPTRHAAHNPAVELNPRRLRQWLFDLPIMNVAETVRLLETRIRPFNEVELDPDERLKLLEVLFEAFDEILFSYDDLRLSMLPITPAERRSLAQDIMWLYLQLAAGYKIIVLAHFDNRGKKVREATLVTAMFRALQLLSHALLYAYRAHETPPPLTWLEIHQLYRYARQLKLHRQQLRQIRGYASAPVIERLFKQILLLSVADPYRMSGQAVFESYLLLEDVCQQAELCDSNDDFPPDQAAYRFLYDEDAPPIHCRFAAAAPDRDGGVLLVEGAVKALLAACQQAAPHDAQLLESLAQRLRNPQPRREEREPGGHTVHLCRGFESIRYYLEQPTRLERALEREVTAGIEVVDLDSEAAAEHSLWPCRVGNLSARGYLLQMDAETILGESLVGELVGIADAQRHPQDAFLHTGLVRWQKQVEDGRLHLGVEIVPGRPRPMRIQPINGAAEACDGFHYAVDRDAGRPAALLLPAAIRETDTRFRVQIAGQAYVITLQRNLIATERWCLCTFGLPP